jgi:hypothetical protein
MFEAISWSSYWLTVFVLAVIYYLVIVLLYFKRELAGLIRRRSSDGIIADHLPEPELQQYFQNEISAFIQQSGQNASAKEEMLFGLQRLFHAARFEGFDKTAYKEAINKDIINECQQYCSVHLSEEDLRVLWR